MIWRQKQQLNLKTMADNVFPEKKFYHCLSDCLITGLEIVEDVYQFINRNSIAAIRQTRPV